MTPAPERRPGQAQSLIVIGLVLAVIILPFVLFGDRIEKAAVDWTATVGPNALAAGTVSLLALDILLPIPSSIVSLIAGKSLGFLEATLAIWTGMTAGCLVGVLAARGALAPVVRALGVRLPRQDNSANFLRWGWVSLVLMRPIPVLAEASVLFAAMRGYPTGRLMLATSVANLPIAALYAYAGNQLLGGVPLWIAFAILAAISAPALLQQLFNCNKSSNV